MPETSVPPLGTERINTGVAGVFPTGWPRNENSILACTRGDELPMIFDIRFLPVATGAVIFRS
jgi:hypothetical protein